MKLLTNLKKDWKLIVISYDENSPLKNHSSNEIGIDMENKQFYILETFLVVHGLNDIQKSCEKFIEEKLENE